MSSPAGVYHRPRCPGEGGGRLAIALSQNARVFVAGHTGLVGAAVVRKLVGEGIADLVFRPRAALDLRDGRAVEAFLRAVRPDAIAIALRPAVDPVSKPADALLGQLAFLPVLKAAERSGIERLVWIAPADVYPRNAPLPTAEEHLWTGRPGCPAAALLAEIELATALNRQHGTRFLTVVSSPVYGFGEPPGRLVPTLLRTLAEARDREDPTVALPGTGSAQRELLWLDDLAAAVVFLLGHPDPAPEDGIVNVGPGVAQTDREVAALAAQAVGYSGELTWDLACADPAPRLLATDRLLRFGFKPATGLGQGLAQAAAWLAR